MKKFATIHLLIINEEKYIDGACISVSSYRKYGNDDIEHIILIDDSIIDIDKLYRFFDKVIKIKLLKFNHDFNLSTDKLKVRYGSWADYAFNKWYALTLEQYEKVLFVDIDTLAVQDYSNIFNIEAPAWCMFHKTLLERTKYAKRLEQFKTGNQMTKEAIYNFNQVRISKLCKVQKHIFIPVNASIVLLEPDCNDFKGMKRMINDKINKHGLYKSISAVSFPDENILFEYYHCVKKIPVYIIGPEYLTTEWRMKENKPIFRLVDQPIILNYDSTDKPWLKDEKDLYPEEKIWFNYREKLHDKLNN